MGRSAPHTRVPSDGPGHHQALKDEFTPSRPAGLEPCHHIRRRLSLPTSLSQFRRGQGYDGEDELGTKKCLDLGRKATVRSRSMRQTAESVLEPS